MKYDTVEAHTQYRFLHALREALRRRSSDGIFVLLADDCSLESEYYSAHKHGKAEVEAFLEQSLSERWTTSDLFSYDLAEIRETPDAPDGLFGVQIRCGGSDNYHYSVLITTEIDSQGKAKQLRIEDAGTCMIRLFERVFCLTSEKDRDPELPVPFLLPGVYWDYLRFGLQACDFSLARFVECGYHY